MRTQTTPGISRRTWRTAIIVFLAVFLGGSSVSGAYALWSQQATVTTQVTTGTWVPVLENGWTWTPSITVRTVPSGNAHHQILIDWPDVKSSTTVTYDVKLIHPQEDAVRGRSAVFGDTSAMQYEIHHNKFLPGDTFTFTVSATVDGKTSATVTRNISIDKNGIPTIRP
jgi:predicted ribosomally synthesized peptide with SipW-like signal peptide